MRRAFGLLLLSAACGGEPVGGDCDPQRDACVLSHGFGAYTIDAGTEIDGVCMSWTLGNDSNLWINTVATENDGLFHHSNWFFVPEEDFDLPDGHWNCWEHDFTELTATIAGGVLYAQSTQTESEEQRFNDGAAIVVPARSRIIAYTHLLNTRSGAADTEMRVELETLSPDAVATVLTPFRLNYSDLHLAPRSASTFTGSCEIQSVYEKSMHRPFDFKLHWALPHFHQLGTSFRLELTGGANDGETIFELEHAYGDPLGHAFAEPVDLVARGANGVRFTCGYENPRDEEVGFGIGDQEMCVMLGFSESGMLFDAFVDDDTVVEVDAQGVARGSGPCTVVGVRYPHAP